MNNLHSLGRILILFGVIITGAGLLLIVAGKVPWLGKLPGDIYVQKKNFTFYFPFATSILASLIISLILWALNRK